MKRFLSILFVIATLSGVGFAQSGFAGGSISGLSLPTDNIYAGNVFLGFLGGQVGSYDLLGPVGARATLDFSITPITGVLSGSADLLFASTGDAKVYGGAGLGVLSLLGVSAPFGKAFVGGDFSVSDTVSLFVEAAPIYVFQSETLVLGGRFGVNFAFGE